jgi:phosphatidylinositol-3-phosphatase
MGAVAAALFVIALTIGTAYTLGAASTQTTAHTGSFFNYILTIVMENHGLNDTYGSQCRGNCTYITQLANQYSLAKHYSSIGHPSLPNYLALTSGGNYDRPPFDHDCSPQNLTTGCYLSVPNIVDNAESSGFTWRAYMEDQTRDGCVRSRTIATYESTHNPFLYYTDIFNNATRCSKIVDANPATSGFLALPTKLLSDLNSTTTASNYMWLTPNLCNDGHNLCAPLNNTVSQANMYLSQLVPKILNSTVFKTQNAALCITWDESSSSTNNIVATIWAGPAAKKLYKSNLAYTHYSQIQTVEASWNLPPLNLNDASATAMTEFFNPVFTGAGGGRRPIAI